MKAAFHTLGCKVNQYDTEAMLEAFEQAGYDIVPFSDEADVYLINTCTVTGTGDQKSMKLMRRIAREHPRAGIIAAGCLAQRDAETLLAMPGIKLVIGVQRRAEVVRLYERALMTGEPINAVAPLKGAGFENLFVTRHEGKTRATMKIQEGCDRYCAYCIIPSVRGPVRSMPLENVRAEARRLAGAGYKEIVVTGIHMASYGRGTDESLVDAISAVHATGARVRIGSLEPVVVTDDFARRLAEMPNLMRQFHLSLQSGSAGVLKRMRRRYTPGEYMRAVETIRRFMPDSALTTDVLTGFPGETDMEAQETLKFVEDAAFARIHVFPYSRRRGTVADAMENQVPENIKHNRAQELIELGNKLETAFVKSTENTVQTVLFERRTEKLAEGYTQHYVRVFADAQPGEIRDVLITHTIDQRTYGLPYIPGGR
jgi:threonylcarbamoyladenosine tRNA methylthiotransferase MtaB